MTQRKPKGRKKPIQDRATKAPSPLRTEITEDEWSTLERMAYAMCTTQEMADYLGISKRTFYAPHLKERFDTIVKKAAASTRLKVREHQLDQALGKSPVGYIWWGKQHLQQTDRHVVAPQDGGPLDQIQGAAQRLAEVMDKLAKRHGGAPSA